MSSRVSKLWFPCIHVESTSLPRADNGITSFANIPVRLLSSLLPLLMHDGQSNQRGPCLPNVYTIRRLPIFIFSKRVFKIFLFPQTNNNETNLQIFLKENKKLFHINIIYPSPLKYSKFFNYSILYLKRATFSSVLQNTSRETVQKSHRISPISYPTHSNR